MHHEQRTLTQQHRDCIAACFSCARICDTCSDDMIGMESHGDDMELMRKCIRACRECADICVLAGKWMSRTSPWSDQLCRLCADMCDQCAELCERHASHHALCGACAQECRRCANLCREMTGAHAG